MSMDIELLAPAGDWEAFVAAVENGADAVYMGGKLFNARQFAGNFDDDLLEKAMAYAHVRNVRVYLTMNTLLTDNEMEQAVEYAERAYVSGIDGIIVQDMGFAGMLRKLLPGLELHASTQMTVYNLEGVKQLENMGFSRVVLARELSLEEIRGITSNTKLEIEVFVHGALCVCYSGQCLMSSMIGGRSGNRGRCAQPCRLKYELLEGDTTLKSKGTGYLMSPKDLSSIGLIGEAAASGIKSLKIEGRMKNPEYVATVVRIYRKYLDAAVGNPHRSNDINIDKQDMKELTQIFNRGGFTEGYLKGKTGRDMMCCEKPKNWGIYLGEVISYDRGTRLITIKPGERLMTGDGLEVWNGQDESPGTVISEIKVNGRNVDHVRAGELAAVGSLIGAISKGDKVYKTSDRELNAAARETYSGKSRRKLGLDGKIVIKKDVPLSFSIYDGKMEVTVKCGFLPEAALNRPLSRDKVEEQLNKTGATPFYFKRLYVEMDESLSLPVSVLNNLRREALEEMELKKSSSAKRSLYDGYVEKKKGLLNFPGNSRKATGDPGVSIYLYRLDESIDYSSLKVKRIYVPFREFVNRKWKSRFSEWREGNIEVFAALPSITRGNYDTIIKANLDRVAELGADGVLLGNIGSLELFGKERPEALSRMKIAGDYSLNAFNSFTIKELFEHDLDSVTLSYEMNLGQISDIKRFHPVELEAAVYGRLPLMTSEYCPVGSIAGGMSASTRCSVNCTGNSYRLKDRKGMEFPVFCDKIDCRSTILNSNVLLMTEKAGSLQKAGVTLFRLYIYDEKADRVNSLVNMYKDAINGKPGFPGEYGELIDRIKAEGFTKGHYFRGV